MSSDLTGASAALHTAPCREGSQTLSYHLFNVSVWTMYKSDGYAGSAGKDKSMCGHSVSVSVLKTHRHYNQFPSKTGHPQTLSKGVSNHFLDASVGELYMFRILLNSKLPSPLLQITQSFYPHSRRKGLSLN